MVREAVVSNLNGTCFGTFSVYMGQVPG